MLVELQFLIYFTDIFNSFLPFSLGVCLKFSDFNFNFKSLLFLFGYFLLVNLVLCRFTCLFAHSLLQSY